MEHLKLSRAFTLIFYNLMGKKKILFLAWVFPEKYRQWEKYFIHYTPLIVISVLQQRMEGACLSLMKEKKRTERGRKTSELPSHHTALSSEILVISAKLILVNSQFCPEQDNSVQ